MVGIFSMPLHVLKVDTIPTTLPSIPREEVLIFGLAQSVQLFMFCTKFRAIYTILGIY